jgi:hypothetical protein
MKYSCHHGAITFAVKQFCSTWSFKFEDIYELMMMGGGGSNLN